MELGGLGSEAVTSQLYNLQSVLVLLCSMPKPDVVGHLDPSEWGCYRPPSFPRKRKEF